jgi:hypothetical protein
MTRKKFNYKSLILQDKFSKSKQGSKPGTFKGTVREIFAKSRRELEIFSQKDEAEAGVWVYWPHGPAKTHNPDGSHTVELTNWLKINERWIEIKGYAEISETPKVWNPEVQSWIIDRGEFKFSPEYRGYLLSEGYVERWIECHENRLSSQFESLSQSFMDEYIQRRIMETEIPHPKRQDRLGYDPLKGLRSEGQIYEFQVEAKVNSLRTERLFDRVGILV